MDPADPPVRGTGSSFSVETDFCSLGNLTYIGENPFYGVNFSRTFFPGVGQDSPPVMGRKKWMEMSEIVQGVFDKTELNPIQSTLLISPFHPIKSYDTNNDA